MNLRSSTDKNSTAYSYLRIKVFLKITPVAGYEMKFFVAQKEMLHFDRKYIFLC